MAEGVRCKKLEKVTIDIDVDKYFQVGVQLPPQEKEELVAFLRKNVDVFAWKLMKLPRWTRISFVII